MAQVRSGPGDGAGIGAAVANPGREMLHESLASSSRAAAPADRPVAGGEAWVLPREPAVHPWLVVSPPAVRITDRRAARSETR